MIPVINLGVCKSADEFICQIKEINKLDWSNNNFITNEAITQFIAKNEGFFIQLMNRADGRQALGFLATRVKIHFPASTEKLTNISTASFTHLPRQIQQIVVNNLISTYSDVLDIRRTKRTAKAWLKMTRNAQVKFINEKHVALSNLGLSHKDIIVFLERLNQGEKPQEGKSKEKQTFVTCLNLQGYGKSKQVISQINGLLTCCPHVDTLMFGSNEAFWLNEYEFVKDPKKSEPKRIK